MRTFRSALLAGAALLLCTVCPASKPRVHIVATGGTIAGVASSASSSVYASGKIDIQAIIDAVPQLAELAEVTGEQFVIIPSQDMEDGVWLGLAKRIGQILGEDDCDAVVVTHGTDTMEETAYFLNLTIHSDKPVVMVGAMRPSNALGADGPANLYNAVACAVSPQARGQGVLVCMNNQIIDAKSATKTHTIDCDTFKGGPLGVLGYVYNGKAHIGQTVTSRHTTRSEFDVSKLDRLPRVGVVYGYAGCSPLPVQAFVDARFDGIVIAGVGDGNLHRDVLDVAVKAQAKGIQVVRSSRCQNGPTCKDGEVDDDRYHFVASLSLNPQKARVLLMLALTRTRDWMEIQRMFMEY